MRLRIHCRDWMAEERGGIAVGDSLSDWLTLHLAQGRPAEVAGTYEGWVTPLSLQEGVELHHHAYRLNLGPVAAYWESTLLMAEGPITATGVLEVDTYRAPPDWPRTSGVVVRMWTAHFWHVRDPVTPTLWHLESSGARYEEVSRFDAIPDRVPEPHAVRQEVCRGVLLEVDVEPAG